MAIQSSVASRASYNLQPQPLPLQFGVNGKQVKSTVQHTKIQNLWIAEPIFRFAENFKLPRHPKSFLATDIHVFNLSLEDWASRVAILFGLYGPQTAQAFIQDKHKWETLGRNFLAWSLTLGLTIAIKADALPVTKTLTQFIRQKVKPEDFKLGNEIRPYYQQFIRANGADLITAEQIARKHPKQADQWQKISQTITNLRKACIEYNVEGIHRADHPFNVAATMEKLTQDLKTFVKPTEANAVGFSIKRALYQLTAPVNHFIDQSIRTPLYEGLQKLINPLRIPNDVSLKTIFKKAGFSMDPEKWDGLDGTLHKKLRYYLEGLEQKVAKNAATELEQKSTHIIKSYIVRRGLFQTLKTTMIALTMLYIIGGLVMDLTFYTFARLDKDFDIKAFLAKKTSQKKDTKGHTPSLDLLRLENELAKGTPPQTILLDPVLKESVWRNPQDDSAPPAFRMPLRFSRFHTSLNAQGGGLPHAE
jgi:hypothetical protein